MTHHQLPKIAGRTADGALTYRHVAVHELRQLWPELQYGLELVRSTNGEPWIVEDVYSELLHGRADLYVFETDEGDLQGLAIFQVLYFPFEFKPRLNVWIGWSKSPRQGRYGEEVAHLLKRAAGFDSVVFATSQENAWVNKHHKLFTWYEIEG